MSNEVQVLIKINNFGKGDINSFKKHMYNGLSLIHMHQVNDFRVDATVKDFDIDHLNMSAQAPGFIHGDSAPFYFARERKSPKGTIIV